MRDTSAPRRAALRVRLGLVAVCLLALGLGMSGIANESDVSLQGDMPKYLMNGVFVLDVMRDRPFGGLTDLVEYTRLYYARYPALSIGHHPILLPMLEAPMFGLFGVSVSSARIVMLLSAAAAVAFLYLLVNAVYGLRVAFLAAALFATSPLVVMQTRSVMSEMPTVALIVAGFYYLHRFCTTERTTALMGFVAAAVLSLYAKQLAIFIFPAFLVYAAATLGLKRLCKRDVLLAFGALGIATAPLIPITLVLSRHNVQLVMTGRGGVSFSVLESIGLATLPQLALPVLALAAIGALVAIVRKDQRSLLFLLWVGSVSPGLVLAGAEAPARFTIYWVPAFCTLAASMAANWRSPATRHAVLVVFLALVGLQASTDAVADLPRADGYEEAARYVLQANPGPTVMFSGDVDTGFFTFFIRKHDAARQLVVLRADKVFTTSLMDQPSVEDRIERPDEIYQVLQTFGTRYIVIEDRPSQSHVLEWLRDELRSTRFVERRRIPIGTADIRLRNTSLVVYEFIDATPPDEAAVLDLHLPIVRQSVTVKLADLIKRKYFR